MKSTRLEILAIRLAFACGHLVAAIHPRLAQPFWTAGAWIAARPHRQHARALHKRLKLTLASRRR